MAKPEHKQKCPICRKPTAKDFAPFCSRGCKDRDLLNWLGDGYRVPGPPADPERMFEAENGLDSTD